MLRHFCAIWGRGLRPHGKRAGCACPGKVDTGFPKRTCAAEKSRAYSDPFDRTTLPAAGAIATRSTASGAPGEMPLQHRLGRGIGLLQIDTPVFELLERNRSAGDGATHEGARPHHAKVAVEIFHLRLARHGGRTIEPIQHLWPPTGRTASPFVVMTHNIVNWRRPCKPSGPPLQLPIYS